jgi:hypothetical protein
MEKLIAKFCNWFMTKQQQKAQKIQKQLKDAKLEEAGAKLKQLYEFVKFINEKGFRNRNDRKAFWNNVEKGQPLIEEHLLHLLRQYGVQEESLNAIKNAKYRAEKKAEAVAKEQTKVSDETIKSKE